MSLHIQTLHINITWDQESAVWIAESEDVPGLVLESGSFDALVERVKHAVPELLDLNNMRVPQGLNIRFLSDRMGRVDPRV